MLQRPFQTRCSRADKSRCVRACMCLCLCVPVCVCVSECLVVWGAVRHASEGVKATGLRILLLLFFCLLWLLIRFLPYSLLVLLFACRCCRSARTSPASASAVGAAGAGAGASTATGDEGDVQGERCCLASCACAHTLLHSLTHSPTHPQSYPFSGCDMFHQSITSSSVPFAGRVAMQFTSRHNEP